MVTKYKMTSKFGDFYDHVKDVSVFILIFIVVLFYFKGTVKAKIIFTLAIIFMFILMSMHLGCQEKIYPKNESDTLKFTKYLCFGDPKDTIKVSRFFGCGTMAVFIIIAVFFMIKKTKEEQV